jgi:hypothetical protein
MQRARGSWLLHDDLVLRGQCIDPFPRAFALALALPVGLDLFTHALEVDLFSCMDLVDADDVPTSVGRDDLPLPDVRRFEDLRSERFTERFTELFERALAEPPPAGKAIAEAHRLGTRFDVRE